MALEELNRKTKRLETMYGAQDPKADVDRLYLRRYEGWKRPDKARRLCASRRT